MCGIIGYIGEDPVVPILTKGLQRLEYRGYDSAGIAVINGNNKLSRVRIEGKVHNLASRLSNRYSGSTVGIGHTRWATHGKPSEDNAHPHTCCKNEVMIVHNGIIENHLELRNKLIENGCVFTSETDSEVIAHLIEKEYNGDLVNTVKRAVKNLHGTYGIAVLHVNHPHEIVATRCGSPLAVGISDNGTFISSDVAAFLNFTNRAVYLEDNDVVRITNTGFTIDTLTDTEVEREPQQIEWEQDSIELDGFPHYMLKEIFEQPETVTNALRGRLIRGEGIPHLGGLNNVINQLKDAQHLVIVSCGSSYYAGLYGRYIFEKLTDLTVEVEIASEMRYRKTNIRPGTIVLAISQSGETADTIAAMREAERKGALLLGLVNVVGSTLSRITEAGVYNHAGIEIGVASTKVFTSQCCILIMFALLLGRLKQLSVTDGMEVISGLEWLPNQILSILKQANEIKAIADKYLGYNSFLFLGRKYNYPIALEGALKLKEISYIHAEGCPAGEMKHGFIAMINEEFPSICVITKDTMYDKMISNIEEIKSRNGKVIAIASEGDDRIKDLADDVIYVPENLDFIQSILSAIVLQLFAYYFALGKGCEIDQPRNLAKSVTVE